MERNFVHVAVHCMFALGCVQGSPLLLYVTGSARTCSQLLLVRKLCAKPYLQQQRYDVITPSWGVLARATGTAGLALGCMQAIH
jgi:hypothetical protein